MERPVVEKVRRMCHGKRAYATEKQANRVVVKMWGSHPELSIGEIHSYLCPLCQRYHVGHDMNHRKEAK